MIKLTDYQIASAFQPILKGIYKAKMRELNEELSSVYSHLDRLDIPKYSNFDRWYARECLSDLDKFNLKAIEHIQCIRRIKVNEKNNSKELDVKKAHNIDIKTLYEFKFKGKNVCCPFHADLHPSASIKYNRLVCFSCGFKGDAIAFLMKLNNIGFKEAVGLINDSL